MLTLFIQFWSTFISGNTIIIEPQCKMCLLLSVLNESTTYRDPPSVVRLEGAKVGRKANDEDDLSIRIEVRFCWKKLHSCEIANSPSIRKSLD